MTDTNLPPPAAAQHHRRVWQPIHGMIAAFPLTCFVGALITDIAYARSAQMQWANFSVWLIAAGVAMGVVAALAGIADAVVTRRKRKGSASWHNLLTIVMLIVAIINGFIHSRDGWTSVVPTGLVLSAITAVLVLVTSWNGYSVAERS